MDNGFAVSEVECKSIISTSRIPSLDYSVNPYTGCQHGCVYCYARFMTRYTKHKMAWGRFADVKINAPEVLEKQIIKLRRGRVTLSTVTDPYQPQERKYGITRRILIELASCGFPVSILTKSDLVLRDIDILKRFGSGDREVGFSMAALDEDVRANFEPCAPPVKNRIRALKKLHSEGIKTWVFIAPVLPYLTELSIFDLLDEIKGSADHVLVDKLNIKCGNWQGISDVLMKKYPRLAPKWRDMLFSGRNRRTYCQNINREIAEFCGENDINVQFCKI